MRGTNSRDLILKDVFVTEKDLLMPRSIFGKTLPNWPHKVTTLAPAYVGVAQGAHDFNIAYPQGRVPGQPQIDRQMYATKRVAVSKMYARLANMRALWWQAFCEGTGMPSKAKAMRIYAAQKNVTEGVEEITAPAISTCGGQSMLKSLPLKHMYRDSRCGALMLPYTSETIEDFIGALALYALSELDKAPRDEGGTCNSLRRGGSRSLKGLR
jgi:alkylation response protein AidB-like acyl-CoA dehydrogenase